MKTFVIMSHKLTDEQITDLNSEVILLSNVNPELAQVVKQIDPSASLDDIMKLSLRCIEEAVKSDCKQMICMGEPCFSMWVNLFASCSHHVTYFFNKLEMKHLHDFIESHHIETDHGDMINDGYSWIGVDGEEFEFKCLQSTTKRESVDVVQDDGSVRKVSTFRHVQWRSFFA